MTPPKKKVKQFLAGGPLHLETIRLSDFNPSKYENMFFVRGLMDPSRKSVALQQHNRHNLQFSLRILASEPALEELAGAIVFLKA